MFQGAGKTLDLSKPVAVVISDVLGHVVNWDEAVGLVRRVMDKLPSGQLAGALSHSTAADEEHREVQEEYNRSGAIRAVSVNLPSVQLFDGLELIDPLGTPLGLVGCLNRTLGQPPTGRAGAESRASHDDGIRPGHTRPGPCGNIGRAPREEGSRRQLTQTVAGKAVAFEAGSGADEGDEVGCVHSPPRCWADSTSLKTMAGAAAREPTRWVTFVRRRTVEKVTRWGFGPDHGANRGIGAFWRPWRMESAAAQPVLGSRTAAAAVADAPSRTAQARTAEQHHYRYEPPRPGKGPGR